MPNCLSGPSDLGWTEANAPPDFASHRSKTFPIKRPCINPCPQICKPSDGSDSKKQQKTCKESFSVVCRGEDAIFHDCRITFSEKGQARISSYLLKQMLSLGGAGCTFLFFKMTWPKITSVLNYVITVRDFVLSTLNII